MLTKFSYLLRNIVPRIASSFSHFWKGDCGRTFQVFDHLQPSPCLKSIGEADNSNHPAEYNLCMVASDGVRGRKRPGHAPVAEKGLDQPPYTPTHPRTRRDRRVLFLITNPHSRYTLALRCQMCPGQQLEVR